MVDADGRHLRDLEDEFTTICVVGSASYEIQVRACQYIETVGFKPKIRSGNEEEQYGHMITDISKIASNARSAPDWKPSKKKRVWNLVKRIFS